MRRSTIARCLLLFGLPFAASGCYLSHERPEDSHERPEDPSPPRACDDPTLGLGTGCELWAVVTPNSDLATEYVAAGDREYTVGVEYDVGFSISLINAGPSPATVLIDGGALEGERLVRVEPGAVNRVRLPWVRSLAQMAAPGEPIPAPVSAWVPGGAYRVRSDVPIAALQQNPGECPNDVYGCGGVDRVTRTADWSPLLPTRSLGTSYLVATRASEARLSASGESTRQRGGFVAIVGVAPSTRVRVALPSDTVAGTVEPAHAAGAVVERDLQPGDVWLLVSGQLWRPEDCAAVEADDGSSVCDLRAMDLTGSEVTASEPVAVFAGHSCANVPFLAQYCDHLEAQLLPLHQLGTRYTLVASGPEMSRRVGVVRIVSPVDGNELRVGDERLTLDRRGWVERTWSGVLEVRSEQPVAVVQFAPSQTFNESFAGDPSMFVPVPEHLWQTRYDIVVPELVTFPQPFEWTAMHAILASGDSVLLNGSPATGSIWTHDGPTQVHELRLLSSGHTVVASSNGEPFGLTLSVLGPSVGIAYAPF